MADILLIKSGTEAALKDCLLDATDFFSCLLPPHVDSATSTGSNPNTVFVSPDWAYVLFSAGD